MNVISTLPAAVGTLTTCCGPVGTGTEAVCTDAACVMGIVAPATESVALLAAAWFDATATDKTPEPAPPGGIVTQPALTEACHAHVLDAA